MNQNIPKRFYKDKIYYSKCIETSKNPILELWVWEYSFSRNSWVISSVSKGYVSTYKNRKEMLDTVMDFEYFITKEEYEDLLLIQELKK